MVLSCRNGNGSYTGLSFRELMWQLVEAHDAEVAFWKNRVGASPNIDIDIEVPLTGSTPLKAVNRSLAIESTGHLCDKQSHQREHHVENFKHLNLLKGESAPTISLGRESTVGSFTPKPHPPRQRRNIVALGEPDIQLPEKLPGPHRHVVDLGEPDGVFEVRYEVSEPSPQSIKRTITELATLAGSEGSSTMSKSYTEADRMELRETLVATLAVEEEYPSLNYSKYDQVSYIVDTWISKRKSQAVAILLTFLTTVLMFGLVWTFCFARDDLTWYENFLEGCWTAWTFMSDPGTHADVATVSAQPRRIVGATFAAVGIIFMSAILGMIVDVIREKMEALRKGKSSVVERDHSLILGWTEKAVSIIEELCNANESAGGGTIVVLCRIDKETIEREFATQLPVKRRRGTRVVFRCGNPMVITDLMTVGAPTARATIVLGNDGDPDNSDAEVLRVMLNLRTLQYKAEGHIVVEVRDIDNEPLVKMVGGDCAETLVSHDVLGRLMLMSTKQPGLAQVYESLLGFEGDEFYISEWPQLVGISFGCLTERFPDAVPIGIFTSYGNLSLNPPPDRLMDHGEKILVIAEDDDTYKPEEPLKIEEGKAPDIDEEERTPSKILFCGWRRDVRDIVNHLDRTVKAGSEIHMITGHIPLAKREELLIDEGLDVSSLQRVKLVQHFGNPSVRRRLSALPLGQFTSCMIFADQAHESDTMQADSHSLATLLLLRDLQTNIERKTYMMERTDRNNADSLDSLSKVVQSCPVICEVLDPRTQSLINGNQYLKRSAEFCQSNKITAQMLAMVAESRSLNVLFDEILGVSGNNVTVYPSTRYVNPRERISFWTIAKRASKRQEVLIGYKAKSHHRVFMNPPWKNEPKCWEGFDIILISRSES